MAEDGATCSGRRAAQEDPHPPDVLLPVHPTEHDEAIDTLFLRLSGAGGFLVLEHQGAPICPAPLALPPG